MPLQPPSQRRERILIVGYSMSGKSTCWMDVAEWVYRTKAPIHFHVMDSDDAWSASRPDDGHLDEVVTAYEMDTWDEARENVRKIRDVATADDFIVLDMADFVWEKAQTAYTERKFGKEWDEFYLDSLISEESMAGPYGQNWGAINKMYKAVMDPVLRHPGHVIACTPGDTVKQPDPKTGKGGDPLEVRELAGRYGVKPVGQKKLPYSFHTVLLMQQTPSAYTLTTLRERRPPGGGGRVDLVAERLGTRDADGMWRMSPGFTVAYLVKVAGWKMGG